MLKTKTELQKLVASRFKLPHHYAEALLKYTDDYCSYKSYIKLKEIRDRGHDQRPRRYHHDLNCFDQFDRGGLVDDIAKGEKYLAIDADKGLEWHWSSDDTDHKEVIEQSLINFELWLFDRRLDGYDH